MEVEDFLKDNSFDPAEVFAKENFETKAHLGERAIVKISAAEALILYYKDPEGVDVIKEFIRCLRINSRSLKNKDGIGISTDAFIRLGKERQRIKDLKEVRTRKEDEEV